MKKVALICLFALISLSMFGQEAKNRVILRKGQKIFLERGDFMADKIYGVTDKTDTVEVILADKTFYKFKRDTFEAWAITGQLNQLTEILGKESEVVYPFKVKLDKVVTVYNEGKLGADKMRDLKKGQTVNVKQKLGYFYEVEFDGVIAYAHISAIPEPTKTHYHIMRAIYDEINSPPASQSQESYIRSHGKFISKYQSAGYTSETYRIDNTYYTFTTFNGKTEMSTYVR